MSSFTSSDEYHVWFDSLIEMEKELPAMIAVCNANRWQSDVMRDNGQPSRSWFGCEGRATEAMRLVRDGWPELLAKLAPVQQRLRQALELQGVTSVQLEVRRRKRHRSDHGDTLDMHRVWGGQLDTAWERPVKENRMAQSQRYASIYVDSAVNCNINSEQTLWRTAAAMTIVDTLTKMGVNTEVWSGATAYRVWEHGPYRAFSGVRVKEYTQPINEDRLATMVSVAFFRTWLFGCYMAAPYKCTWGIGHSANAGFVKPLRDRLDKGERVFRLGNCLSFEGAMQEVTTVVNTLKTADRDVA